MAPEPGRAANSGTQATQTTQATIAAIHEAAPEWLAPLDRHAARVLADLAGEADKRVRLALALASRQVRTGSVALDVRRLAGAGGAGPEDEYGARIADLVWPPAGPWLEALAASPLVAVVPDGAPPDVAPVEPRPLVLEATSGRLYLRRWWEHEAALAQELLRRAGTPADYDAGRLAEGLARLFPEVEGTADMGRRDQAHAAALAVAGRLTVITGGPGTGKTTTVVRLLALLGEQAVARGDPLPRSLLLAPTGKAAVRLEEAVGAARQTLDTLPAVRDAIPAEGRTIHRALGWRPDGSWRHSAENPLPADVVVVDEASMIDVALMRALLEAVRPQARLVILGDRDQLASVEAGAVLADLCGPPGSPDQAGTPQQSGTPDWPLGGCIARLRYSFRFGPQTGIGALARAVLDGDADLALAILDDPRLPEVARVEARPAGRDGRLHPVLAELVAHGYGPYLDELAAEPGGETAAARALAALGRFRVLCAHRRGPLGAGAVGMAVVETLARQGRISPNGPNWVGRPVQVDRNDYGSRLWNGDVGVLAPDAASGAGRLRAWFPAPDGSARPVSPAQLPPHETALATSIHKSQGSEFDAVVVVLPEEGSPLLARELVYTAVTRARHSVTVFGGDAALRSAIGRRAQRTSGLGARLWGG